MDYVVLIVVKVVFICWVLQKDKAFISNEAIWDHNISDVSTKEDIIVIVEVVTFRVVVVNLLNFI